MKLEKAKKRDRRIKRVRYGIGRGGKTLIAHMEEITNGKSCRPNK